ncbi:MAG: hypothetical protein J2O49_09115, partial [Sciscionella sp.]|nr:hypothetical protein [Sciscionella sp.]
MTDLPPNWEWTTLGEICAINPRNYDVAPGDDDLISVIPMAAVQAETGIIDASKHASYGTMR